MKIRLANDSVKDGRGVNTDEDGHSADEEKQSNENQDNLICPICLSYLNEQQIGLPNSCQHAFCLECILQWSETANSCPVDRTKFQSIWAYHCYGGSFMHELPMPENAFTNEDNTKNCCGVCCCKNDDDMLSLCDGYATRSCTACLNLKVDEGSPETCLRKYSLPRKSTCGSMKTPVLSRQNAANFHSRLLPVAIDKWDEYCVRDIESAPSYLIAQKHRSLSLSRIRYNIPLPTFVSFGDPHSREVSNSFTFPILDANSSTFSDQRLFPDLSEAMMVPQNTRSNSHRKIFFGSSRRCIIDERTHSATREVPGVHNFAVSPPQSQRVTTTGKQQTASNENSTQSTTSTSSSNHPSTSNRRHSGSFSRFKSEETFDSASGGSFEDRKPKLGSKSEKKSMVSLSLKRQRIMIRPVLNLPKSEEETAAVADSKDTHKSPPQLSESDAVIDDVDDAYNPFEPIVSDEEEDGTYLKDSSEYGDQSSKNAMPLIVEPPSPDPISDIDIDRMLDSQFEEAIETRKKGKSGFLQKEMGPIRPSEPDIGKDLDMFAEEELEKAQAAAKVAKLTVTKAAEASLDVGHEKSPGLYADNPPEEPVKFQIVDPNSQPASSEEQVSPPSPHEISKPAEIDDKTEKRLESPSITTHAPAEETLSQKTHSFDSSMSPTISSDPHRKELDGDVKRESSVESEEEIGLIIRPVNKRSESTKTEKNSDKADHRKKSRSKSPKRQRVRSRSRSRKKSRSSPKKSSRNSHSSPRKRDRSRSSSHHRYHSSRRHRSRTPRRKRSKTPSSRSKMRDDDRHHHRSRRRSNSKDRHKSRKRSRSRSRKRSSEASRKWSSKDKAKRSDSCKEADQNIEKRSSKSNREKDDGEEKSQIFQVDTKKENDEEVFRVEMPQNTTKHKSSQEKSHKVDSFHVEALSDQTFHADDDLKQKSSKKKKHKEIKELSPEPEEHRKKQKKHKKHAERLSDDDESESIKVKLNKKRKKYTKVEENSDSESENKSKKRKRREYASPEKQLADVAMREEKFEAIETKSNKRHAKAKKSKDKDDSESDYRRSRKQKKRERIFSGSENDAEYDEDAVVKKHKHSKKHKHKNSSPNSDQQTGYFDPFFSEIEHKKKKKKRSKDLKDDEVQEENESHKQGETKKKKDKEEKFYSFEKREPDLPVKVKDSKASTRILAIGYSSSSDEAMSQSLEEEKFMPSQHERESVLVDSERKVVGDPSTQNPDHGTSTLADTVQPKTEFSAVIENFQANSTGPFASETSVNVISGLAKESGSDTSSKSSLGFTVADVKAYATTPPNHNVDFEPFEKQTSNSLSDVVMKSDERLHSGNSSDEEPEHDSTSLSFSPTNPVCSVADDQDSPSVMFQHHTKQVRTYADQLLEQSVEKQESNLQHQAPQLLEHRIPTVISASLATQDEMEADDRLKDFQKKKSSENLNNLTEDVKDNKISVSVADMFSETPPAKVEFEPNQDIFADISNSPPSHKNMEQEKQKVLPSNDLLSAEGVAELDNALKSSTSDKCFPERPIVSQQVIPEEAHILNQQPASLSLYENLDDQPQSENFDNNLNTAHNKPPDGTEASSKEIELPKSDDKASTHRSRSLRSPFKSQSDEKASSKKSSKHRRSRSRSRDRKRKRYRRSTSRSPSRKRAYSPRRKRSRSRDRRRPYSDRRRSRSPNRRYHSSSKERYRSSRRPGFTPLESARKSPSPRKEPLSRFIPIGQPPPSSYPAQVASTQEELAVLSPQPIATISGIATVTSVGRSVADDGAHDYQEEIDHHHEPPSNALTSLFNTTRPALIEISTVDHPPAQSDATAATIASADPTEDNEVPTAVSGEDEETTEAKNESDLYSPSFPISPLSPREKDNIVPPPPPPPPKTQESSIDAASKTAMSLFSKLLSLPKVSDEQAEILSKEEDGSKDIEPENKLNPTQILNIVGLKPQLDAKDAIMSIAELSKQLQLGQILNSDKKREANVELPVPTRESDGLSPVNFDSIESSAVAMYNRDKKKIEQQRKEFQDKVVAAAKLAIKPHYERREVSKEQYKDIMKRAVNKICQTDKNMDVNEVKIRRLIRRYVECYQQKNEKGKEKMKAISSTKGTKTKVDSATEFLDSPPSPDESPLTGPDSPYEEATSEITPSLLKKKPRQIVTLPDLPLPPPPPPPRPKYMM